MKAGFKTSEFWVALAAMFMQQGYGVDEALVSETSQWITGMIATAYALGRSWIKALDTKKGK